jgi:hypothetical protein
MYFEHNTPASNIYTAHTRSETRGQGSANFPAGLAPISAARVKNLVLWRGGGHPRLTYPFHDDPACALFLSQCYMCACTFALKSRCRLRLPLDHSPLLCSFISAGDIKTSYALAALFECCMRIYLLSAAIFHRTAILKSCIFTKLSNPRRVCVCVRGVN